MTLDAAGLRRCLEGLPRARCYVVAYSGGLDSRVLLDLCAELVSGDFPAIFRAVHVHHGLQAQADDWAALCEKSCLRLGIPFQLLCVDAAAAAGQSPEEAAREARYGAMKEVLETGEALLTAQHRDDQAETVLLQLFRGAGLKGLAGMPESASFGRGLLLRPLLSYSREDLRRYAERRQLEWVEDPSNRDMAYDRNFLRHRIMPTLKERWPALDRTLCRSAAHCAEAGQLIDRLSRELFRRTRHAARPTLQVDRLAALPDAEQRLVLRAWIADRGVRMPAARVLARIGREVLPAGSDRSPRVHWGNSEIRRFRGELYLLPRLVSVDSTFVCQWEGDSPLSLPFGAGTLEACPTARVGIAGVRWRAGPVTVRFRRGGECCRIAGRSGRHSLKNIFQEKGVPPWVRERIPLVYIGRELAAVGDLLVSEPFQGDGRGSDVALRWQAEHLGWKVHDGRSDLD